MKARLEQGGGSVVDEISGRPLELESLRALAANSLTNKAPLRTLHSGFRGRPPRRFLAADTHTPEGRSDLRVHVLGPLEDRNVIRDMDLPTGQSCLRHLAAATAAAEPVSSQRRSFARHFTIALADYKDGKLSPVAPGDVHWAPERPTNIRIWAAGTSVHPGRVWPEIPRDTRLAKLRRRAKRVILSYRADPVQRHTGAARYRD